MNARKYLNKNVRTNTHAFYGKVRHILFGFDLISARLVFSFDFKTFSASEVHEEICNSVRKGFSFEDKFRIQTFPGSFWPVKELNFLNFSDIYEILAGMDILKKWGRKD